MVNGLYLYSSLLSPEDPKALHTHSVNQSKTNSQTGNGKLRCSHSSLREAKAAEHCRQEPIWPAPVGRVVTSVYSLEDINPYNNHSFFHKEVP